MGYKNFDAAIYCTVFHLAHIQDMQVFEKEFEFIEKHIRCSKVYLETYRSDLLIEKDQILKIKEFFNRKGIKTSGGITTTPKYSRDNAFESFCYNNESHKQRLEEVVRYTAAIFDEVILDDFYFTNCKCEKCIKDKGDGDWASYRTELLKKISEELVMKPAKEVNPKINMIIKFPNWYEDYQSTGYNLEAQPKQFDMIYTGTETREPENTQQHLQRYLSYFLMRYLENVKPEKNGGGWFDGYDCMYNLGSYAEQAYLTLFAKAKEAMLFCLENLLNQHSAFVPVAGYAFDKMDGILGSLGNPMGISCYKPYHSFGENYLHNYLGMLGIPLEPSPEFKSSSNTIFLTSSAAKDPGIVPKIKEHLIQGKKVIITSGFLDNADKKEMEDIVSLTYTAKKAKVNKFGYKTRDCSFENYYYSQKDIMIPQIEYNTNDLWPIIVGISDNNNFPILLEIRYGKGLLYVLTIPEDMGDLYQLPREILNGIRSTFAKDMFVTIDAESKVGLFVYDNNTFVIESFLPYFTTVNIIINKSERKLKEIYAKSWKEEEIQEREIQGNVIDGKTVCKVNVMPGTFQVFKI